MSQPDRALLAKAQQGDEQAFALIVREYELPVFNYVLRCVHNRQLAEDITQETFLRVFRGLPRFSFRSQFTTWMFSVAKNCVLDELRSIERRPRSIDVEDAPPLRAVDVPVERRETMEQLWNAIGRLDVDLRMALLLRDLVGLRYDEIADSLEIPLSAVKWRIYHARQLVAHELAAERDASGADATAAR
jgi:RNA polymerase sigma-70 factor, ECF subfamily